MAEGDPFAYPSDTDPRFDDALAKALHEAGESHYVAQRLTAHPAMQAAMLARDAALRAEGWDDCARWTVRQAEVTSPEYVLSRLDRYDRFNPHQTKEVPDVDR